MNREEWEKLEPVTAERVKEERQVIEWVSKSNKTFKWYAKWFDEHPEPFVVSNRYPCGWTSRALTNISEFRMAPKKPERIERWMNIYPNKTGALYRTLGEASTHAISGECKGQLRIVIERTPNGGWKVLGTEDLEREQ